jgi:hypothetical protein
MYDAGGLQDRARQIFAEAMPQRFEALETKIEVSPQNGMMLLFTQIARNENDPLALLGWNAECQNAAPIVLHPEIGPAKRYTIPFQVWTKPEYLAAFFQNRLTMHTHVPDVSSLRLLRDIPEDVVEYQYGRSKRFTLLLDRVPALLAAQIFPGGLVQANVAVTPERLTRMAWVLLARSCVASKPYPYHMLRDTRHFFSVERAAPITVRGGQSSLRPLEIDLLKGAEEDRRIASALLATEEAWRNVTDHDMNYL